MYMCKHYMFCLQFQNLKYNQSYQIIGEPGYRSLCLMDANHALYHLSQIPLHINYHFVIYIWLFVKSPRWDSNPQPPDPKSDALSIAPLGHFTQCCESSIYIQIYIYINRNIRINIQIHININIKFYNYIYISISISIYI